MTAALPPTPYGAPDAEALALAVAAGAPIEHVAWCWRTGQAADVPIGALWHVVRITRRLGLAVVDHLRSNGAALGPVLENAPRGAVEVLVPPAPGDWPRTLEAVWAPSGLMLWPAPDHRAAGRRWIVAPTPGAPCTTDRQRLRAALEAVRTARGSTRPGAVNATAHRAS